GQARQLCEVDLSLQLVPATIAKRVAEVAGEFHEEVGVQARYRLRILDRQVELLARVAAEKRFAAGDPHDAVVRRKRSEIPESLRQECLTRTAQRLPMSRNGEPRGIAPYEIQQHWTQSGYSVRS